MKLLPKGGKKKEVRQIEVMHYFSILVCLINKMPCLCMLSGMFSGFQGFISTESGYDHIPLQLRANTCSKYTLEKQSVLIPGPALHKHLKTLFCEMVQ